MAWKPGAADPLRVEMQFAQRMLADDLAAAEIRGRVAGLGAR